MESGDDLACANRTAISIADVKKSAITIFCHWSRNWFGLFCCSVFGIGETTCCDSESSIEGEDGSGSNLGRSLDMKLMIEVKNALRLEVMDIFFLCV